MKKRLATADAIRKKAYKMEIRQYLEENPEMKNYSLYLDKDVVLSITRKIKVPLSRVVNDFLVDFNNRLSHNVEKTK